MTRDERNYKLKKYIECLKCEVSGKRCEYDCPTQFEAGNLGEIIENLEAISKILEQEPKTGHWIMHDNHRECSVCNVWLPKDMPRNSYCPNCGAKMESEG